MTRELECVGGPLDGQKLPDYGATPCTPMPETVTLLVPGAPEPDALTPIGRYRRGRHVTVHILSDAAGDETERYIVEQDVFIWQGETA